MLALTITDLKQFMNCFLRSETFDHFLVSEASISTNVTFHIDGHLNNDFYSCDELEENGLLDCTYLPFSFLRPVFFELIKGKHTPVSFKFVLMLSPKNKANVLKTSSSGFTEADVSELFLNFRYQNAKLTCTTGVSYQTFSLNHILDEEWDSMIRRFLTSHDVIFDELS